MMKLAVPAVGRQWAHTIAQPAASPEVSIGFLIFLRLAFYRATNILLEFLKLKRCIYKGIIQSDPSVMMSKLVIAGTRTTGELIYAAIQD